MVTIHNDQMSQVKHVLDFLCVFFSPYGRWERVWVFCKGQVFALPMQFSTSAAQKSKFPTVIFLGVVTTHNDQISHVKHGLARCNLLRPLDLLQHSMTYYGHWIANHVPYVC